MITDPDEITDNILAKQIQETFPTLESTNIGIIYTPLIYYYKGKKLAGTIWGGVKKRNYLFNRERVVLAEDVHYGRKLRIGFSRHTLVYNGDNIVHHFWMISRDQLVEKHRRYLKKEGKAMFERGQKTSLYRLVKQPIVEFIQSFFKQKGYLDGSTGLYLSIFWAWYSFNCHWELLKYQRKYSIQYDSKVSQV